MIIITVVCHQMVIDLGCSVAIPLGSELDLVLLFPNMKHAVSRQF